MQNKKVVGFNPIKYRENFSELKDEWSFSFDGNIWQRINVPFAPQSKLSGIGYTDFIPKCFYKKKFFVQKTDKRIILHFGAVDYEANVYVNGLLVGSHKGGYTPFSFDITEATSVSENLLEIEVLDEFENVPSGKQSDRLESYGCFYTRTTGIWQPVWIEYVPTEYIRDFRFYPNVEEGTVKVLLSTCGCSEYEARIYLDGKEVGCASGKADGETEFTVSLSEKRLWEIGKGNLYDVVLRFGEDTVHSYFGLREVRYSGYDFLVNGKSVFQRLVMAQGYYFDGGYTAPSVEAMQSDIDFAAELGFNGLRLHQKLFDPRYLYLCDKAGMMVWGEFPSWGIDYTNTQSLSRFLTEWKEAIDRDFNHPSIVIWCPLNEVWGSLKDKTAKRDVKYIDEVYAFTKQIDSTRPCVDVSGGHHGTETDLYDFHSYESPEVIDTYLQRLEQNGELNVPLLYNEVETHLRYRDGIPVNISEFGGIALGDDGNKVEVINECAVQCTDGWGYGKGALTEDDFVKRYQAFIDTIYRYKKISGFCYTQLYDVEQERNGFCTYERVNKFSKENIARIKAINESNDCGLGK